MIKAINSYNCLTAWRDACRFIIENGAGSNLIVGIENPLSYSNAHLTDLYRNGLTTALEVSDVSNTIFPHKFFQRHRSLSSEAFFDLHEKLYLRGKTMHAKNRSRWGTYFLRFTKFGSRKHNQLQNIIDAINSRNTNNAACYIMHASSVDYDSNVRKMGNPCLQYVQIEAQASKLNLTAVYRNHDFLNKALGNYIGLSRLLEFACLKTRKQVGSVVCHSIHYYLDQKIKIKNGIERLAW
jgi:thymidylate synthase